MVGDSRYDALTAQQAPCGLLLFDWGYGGGDVSAWADCVVSSAEEALHRLLGSDE